MNRCNNYKYLLLWENLSKLSDKYEDGKCEENWNKFKKNKKNKEDLNIGSFLFWAKNDNIQKYENFIQNKKIC